MTNTVMISDARASELSDLAKHRGISHQLHTAEDNAQQVVFEFSTIRDRRSFENLCVEQGITIKPDVQQLILDVLAGQSPASIIEQVVEGKRRRYQITYGMANALSKGRIKFRCAHCGLACPVYPGSYPSKCPQCQTSFE